MHGHNAITLCLTMILLRYLPFNSIKNYPLRVTNSQNKYMQGLPCIFIKDYSLSST